MLRCHSTESWNPVLPNRHSTESWNPVLPNRHSREGGNPEGVGRLDSRVKPENDIIKKCLI